MLQSSSLQAAPLAERLRSGAGRRALALGLVILIEALLLLMLLTLGAEKRPGSEQERPTVLDFIAEAVPEAAPEDTKAETEEAAEEPSLTDRPAEPSQPREEAEPLAEQAAQPPPPPPAPPPPMPAPQARPTPEIPRSTAPPAPSGRRVYGPPDTGRPAHLRDSERVGTAPNGEPLYAAAWYEKPRREALGAYLSTARGPGWGLIACRTAPGYRVEDCVGIAEYPEGSQIMRSVLAAAWEFKVRPPRLGGRSLVGGWVRIRIDYGIERD